ncbi:MAG: fibronectin type III domain-containing protein [Bacteroidota bacterium]
MKKLGFIAISIAFFQCSNAQSISNYLFSSLNGTFTYLPTTATSPALISGSANEGLYPSISIGFDFFYLGKRITSVQPSTNGWMILGTNVSSGAVASNNFNSFSLPSEVVAPLWDDLDMSSGTFRHQTTGIAPNRVFTAEWRNVEWNWNTNTPVISFQVKLFETTGVIQFEYAQEAGNVAGASASIGIRGLDNTSSNAFISLTGTGTNPTSSTSISTNTLNSKPATGQIYRFSNGTVNAPTGFGFNSRTINSMNITWIDNVSNETGFVIYRSTDNINFVYDGMVMSNTTSYTVQNLISGTTYFYRVFALNEGRLSTALTGSASTLPGTISGVLNVPGNYSSITAALNALRTSGMAGPVVIQLNTTYNNANESYPINVSGLGTASNRTLTIRPASNVTSLVLSSPANTSVFQIFNTNNFIIDGRPGGTGTTRALTILCNNGINTISFFDDCTNDTIRFCRIGLNDNGNGFFPFSSNITFSTNSGFVTGSNNNAILNNEIYGINPPSSLITFSAFGTATSQNNTISNNIMYDFAGNLRFFGSTNAAIYLDGNVNNFTINNNNIYETQSITSTAQGGNPYVIGGIRISSNVPANFTITNNTIGGSNATATGNPWELGPVSDFNGIIPIDVTLQGTSSLVITNNVIRNYFLGSSASFGGFTAFSGIKFTSFSKATGVNISNNTIGRDTGNTSISIVNEGLSPMLVTGILIDAPDTSSVICNGNSIGSFNMTGPGANNGFQFIGICMQSSGTVSNNLIGSLTTNNSILAANTASSSQQTVTGIGTTFYQFFALRNEALTITGNTISGLRNNFNASTNIDRVVGIDALETRFLTINSNLIQQLTSQSSALNSLVYPVKGIQVTNSSFINQSATAIEGNIVRGLLNSTASGAANIGGIVINSITSAPYNLSRNFIHSFNVNSTNPNTQITGIVLQDGESRLTNNMIRLGINALGISVDAPAAINGVDIINSDNTTLWHNSIFIGGSLINSTTNTFGVKRSGNGSLNLVNNIIVNQRSFTSGTVKRNFAIGLSGFNSFTANHNCYFRLGNGTGIAEVASTVYDTITLWRNASGGDAASGVVNPNFVNPSGNAQTLDLHVFGTTPIESNGTLITDVTVDFDGQNRSTLSPVDIGADAGLFTPTLLPVKWNSFDVVKINNQLVSVNFSVASQTNNKWFFIERSLDGNTFNKVGQIEGAVNSNVLMKYSFNDDISDISQGYVYYRVKQVDLDGSTSTTEIKSVLIGQDASQMLSISAYPNPFSNVLQVQYPAADANGELILFDKEGRTLYSFPTEKDGGELTLDTSSLLPGIYFIRVNNLKVIKVVKSY